MRQWCVWGGSEGGVVVLESRGERMALLNVSGTGVYGMKSQADLMCDGETKCRESAAWLHQEGTLGNFIGSGRGRMRSDLPKGGGYRRSAECVDNSGAVGSAKWYPRPKALFLGFIT